MRLGVAGREEGFGVDVDAIADHGGFSVFGADGVASALIELDDLGLFGIDLGGEAAGDDIEPEDVVDAVPFVDGFDVDLAIFPLCPLAFEVADDSPLGRIAEGEAALEVDLHFSGVALVFVALVAVDLIGEAGDLGELGHALAVDLGLGEGDWGEEEGGEGRGDHLDTLL